MKVNLFVPAGPRTMAGDPQGRTEIIARQEWGRKYGIQGLSGAVIGFGLQLQAPERLPKDFSPEVLNGLPYGIHAHPEALSNLWRAERDGDKKYINEFWGFVRLWSVWEPPPSYVVYHVAGFGEVPPVPPIEPNRFNLTIEPKVWLERAKWHERIFSLIKETGLKQVVLETLPLCNYYGPPYFPDNWLPITYLAPRVGIYQDTVEVTRAAGVGSLVDFEHLESTVQSLRKTTIEIQELEKPCFAEIAGSEADSEFERYFGFAAQEGRICQAESACWEKLVTELKTPYYHVGGINPQVLSLEPKEAQTEYHQALQEQLGNHSYAWKLSRFRRGGSHGSIKIEDVQFREMLQHVLRTGKDLDEPIVLVVETANYREDKKPCQDPGFWYWAESDAMERSLQQLRQILLAEL